jgi:hypothetical protein
MARRAARRWKVCRRRRKRKSEAVRRRRAKGEEEGGWGEKEGEHVLELNEEDELVTEEEKGNRGMGV